MGLRVYYIKQTRYIRFFIPIPSFNLIIKAASSEFKGTNKRRRGVWSRFTNISRISVWEESLYLEDLDSFTITEKEFVRWLGMLSIDQVKEMTDIDWILKINKEYENILENRGNS